MKSTELEDMFRVTNDMLSVVDQNGRFLKLNESWSRVLGYSLEEIYTHPNFFELVHPEDKEITAETFKRILKGDMVKSFENRYKSKEGSYIWFNWDSVILPNGNVFSSARDMSENKERQKELEFLAANLEAANRDKDQFISILAHDLRNPFNTLLGFSQYLVENIGSMSNDEVKEQAHYIHDASEKTLFLLEDILLWSKLKVGKLSICKEMFDLTEICELLIQYLKISAEAKGISVECRQKEESYPVFADKNMIKTIIRNLFSNAVKFTHKGGRIILEVAISEKSTNFIVSDTGDGISESALQDIWDPIKSKGLGLSISKELAELNGASLSAVSTAGAGSSFKLSIPNSQ